MKSETLTCITTMTLFAVLVLPTQLAAQEQQTGAANKLATLSTSKASSQRQPSGAVLARLPLDAQAGISATLGRDLAGYHARAHANGFEAENARHKMAAAFTSEGVAVRSGSAVWRLAFLGYGYGDALKAPTTVPQASLNRVEYRRGPLTEWYVNGPLGLEQGFTINQPPARANPRPRGQPLAIALALSGNLTAALDADRKGCTLTGGDGQARLRYAGLAARDATGSPLRAWLEAQGHRLLLKVDDGKARYPVVVDPWVQLAKLHASDGGADDYLGFSVAIDGDTVVIGANVANTASNAEQGAAYVFVKPPSGWANMTETA